MRAVDFFHTASVLLIRVEKKIAGHFHTVSMQCLSYSRFVFQCKITQADFFNISKWTFSEGFGK